MKRNNVPSCIGVKVWKKEFTYMNLFSSLLYWWNSKWLWIRNIDSCKKDDYQQSVAYIKLISIYSHHASIDELQQQVDSIQMMMETYEDYHEFEQYLIENEEHQVIGIDLCALTYNHHYDELDLEELTPDQYYQVGLYYYDQKNMIKH